MEKRWRLCLAALLLAAGVSMVPTTPVWRAIPPGSGLHLGSLELTCSRLRRQGEGWTALFTARNTGGRAKDLSKLQVRWEAGGAGGTAKLWFPAGPILRPGQVRTGRISVPTEIPLRAETIRLYLACGAASWSVFTKTIPAATVSTRRFQQNLHFPAASLDNAAVHG